jgi:hypothetical protein
MNTKIVKGILLMIGVVFTAFQSGNIVWAATIITAVCLGLGYFAKNVWFPSVSDDGVFDWRDVVSALVLSIVATIGTMIGDLVVNDSVNWLLLAKTIVTVVITYFTATFFAPESAEAKALTKAKAKKA